MGVVDGKLLNWAGTMSSAGISY